jgi:hypothetical protein
MCSIMVRSVIYSLDSGVIEMSGLERDIVSSYSIQFLTSVELCLRPEHWRNGKKLVPTFFVWL